MDALSLTPQQLGSDARAADYLDCSKATIWRLVKAGKLTPIRIGGMTRFDMTQVAGLAQVPVGIKAGR